MATLSSSNFVTVARPSQLGSRRRVASASVPSSSIFSKRVHAAKVIAFVQTATQDPIVVNKEVTSKKSTLACPICYNSLTHAGPALSMDTVSESTLLCSTCKKTYFGNKTHLELTASSGAKEYTETMAPATEFFRLPLIPYMYERGWRQGFSAVGGWPRPEKEFELIKGYLEPVLGGNIIDASCGSGPFARLFAKSGLFSLVVALDYSENMLRECYEFIKQEENFPKEDLILVRADISRLPFVSSSVDAVHASAAVHCWSSPSSAVAEISRVLRPGGIFIATTMIYDGPFALNPFLKPMQRACQLNEYFIYLHSETPCFDAHYRKDGCLSPILVLVKMFFSSSDVTKLCKSKLRFTPDIGDLFGNVEYAPDVRKPDFPIRTRTRRPLPNMWAGRF